MSVHHTICNLAKREYFDMCILGEDDRYPATFGYNAHRLLHTFAIFHLCTSGTGSSACFGRWHGDPIEIVCDDDENRSKLIFATYTNISLLLLDSLCDDDEAFFNEILQRGLQDGRWNLPVTTALLILLDDARYKNFRYCSYSYLNGRAEETDKPPGSENRWLSTIKALREHRLAYYKKLGMEPPVDGWEKTFDWRYAPDAF